MEGIHGVDVSWLHHSQKNHYADKSKTPTATSLDETPSPKAPHQAHDISEPTSPEINGTHPSQPHGHVHRPSLLHRANSDKPEVQSPTSTKPPKDPKQGPMGRRNSWMTSLSSKFSSNSNTTATGSSPAPAAASSSPPGSPGLELTNPFDAALTPGAKDIKRQDAPATTPPASPKSGHTFLQSALRRLSSSGGSSIGKAAGTGGVCPRKTMNIDPYRDRCALPDVDQSKLRRVAFCVDVEIAGAAQYTEEDSEAPPAPPPKGVSSLTKLEHELEAKKKNEVKQRKGEGAALKNPSAVAEEKEKEGAIKASGEQVKPEKAPESKTPEASDVKEPTRKKEKKKRSEAERKERKERKYRKALANGDIPFELKREGSDDTTDSSPGAETPPNSQDRPTTDPLRIYRRCCQLRETPILKRIAEQISSPSACHASTPGILSSLDLSGFWMQLPDLITLGDYLAVVPVKRLILENCGLGDEAVRVILAGLLSAKTPEQAKYNKKLCKKPLNGQSKDATERLGVIEKLSLKNNPKIGKEGWRHIALFINMSRSLKAIDLSMIPFPQLLATAEPVKHNSIPIHKDHTPHPTPQVGIATLLQDAIGERLESSLLEELIMAECALSTECIGKLVDGVMKAGCTRLGLANNGLSRKGLEHVIRYVQSGKCEGLDLGGNDLRENLNMLAEALDDSSMLWALSLADCHLSASSLESLLPALVQLPHFRFIDLSHNRDLFSIRPTVLGLIRKYLPQCPTLKRLHLMDVAMTPEHAIALAEVLPECATLAHLNILENHLLSPLASAKTESDQEEACALYASLMAAVRVSHTLICIDIDVPSPESSEVVKALARQVVAYSLRNLERMPLAENSDSAKAAMADPHGGEKQLTVPDVLLHLVGHVDDFLEDHDNDEPAPDEDYIVGGTGVVKALDICLNRAAEGRRKDSRDLSPFESGTGTPVKVLQNSQVSKGKAKDMSKNLLDSARKIRARLQPALIKEAKSGNDMSYRRLQFLDSTLEHMIQRFEDEYPETRLPKPMPSTTAEGFSDNPSASPSLEHNPYTFPPRSDSLATSAISPDIEDDASVSPVIRPSSMPRPSSSPSLAARQAQEEGRMHRFGQRIKRDILRPETQDYAHGTTGTEVEAEYLQDLRRQLESFEGTEIKERVERMGPEAVFDVLGATAEELAQLERSDPEEYERIKQVRVVAMAVVQEQKSPPRTPALEQAMRMYEESRSAPMPIRNAVNGKSRM